MSVIRQLSRQVLQNPVSVVFVCFGGLIIAQTLGAFIASSVIRNGDPALQLAAATGAILLVLVGISFATVRLLAIKPRAMGLVKPARGWIAPLFTAAGLYIVASIALTVLVSVLVPSFDSNQAQDVGLQNPTGTSSLVAGFLALVVFTPLAEELLFRGLLFKGLRHKLSYVVAAGLSAILFAFAHGQWNVALDTFVLGLSLAYLVEKTESIVPSVLLHGTKNLVAFIVLFVLTK